MVMNSLVEPVPTTYFDDLDPMFKIMRVSKLDQFQCELTERLPLLCLSGVYSVCVCHFLCVFFFSLSLSLSLSHTSPPSPSLSPPPLSPLSCTLF